MSASTIAYQLRPQKAIERNLFVAILKKLDRAHGIDLNNYSYAGFGAPFFEDFKIMHLEFGIMELDCIEYNLAAYSRQVFNNPYNFIKLYPKSWTDFVTSSDFRQTQNQIIWLDFASPREFRQQLLDLELTASKCSILDIIKFTFNARSYEFAKNNKCNSADWKKMLNVLKSDPTYQLFLPDGITTKHLIENFSAVFRAMGLRAIERGLAKSGIEAAFNHIAAFDYADGQDMTTVTGIIDSENHFRQVLAESGLENWEFYQSVPADEILDANIISVPVMTIAERMEIDRLVPLRNVADLATEIDFSFGDTAEKHLQLVEGYCRYYKFLPYYSKVTY